MDDNDPVLVDQSIPVRPAGLELADGGGVLLRHPADASLARARTRTRGPRELPAQCDAPC